MVGHEKSSGPHFRLLVRLLDRKDRVSLFRTALPYPVEGLPSSPTIHRSRSVGLINLWTAELRLYGGGSRGGGTDTNQRGLEGPGDRPFDIDSDNGTVARRPGSLRSTETSSPELLKKDFQDSQPLFLRPCVCLT